MHILRRITDTFWVTFSEISETQILRFFSHFSETKKKKWRGWIKRHLHWFCTSIFTDYSLWLRNEIKHELGLLNSQQRTPSKRFHCIAELIARALSLGIADFFRFFSGCSILIKSSDPIFLVQETNFCNNFRSYKFFVEDWRKFLHKILPPKKKALGRTPSFSSVCQKNSHRSCFLIRPSRIYSLFSKYGDKIISVSRILAGWMLWLFFSGSAVVVCVAGAISGSALERGFTFNHFNILI